MANNNAPFGFVCAKHGGGGTPGRYAEKEIASMSWLRKEEWPWWQAGLLLGVLNMAAFYTADYYLSVSTTFSRGAGMVVSMCLERV